MTSEAGTTGIFLPRPFLRSIKSQSSGHHWSSVVIYDTIISSLHVVDHREGGQGELAMNQLSSYINTISSQIVSRGLRVHNIVSMDANTSVPGAIEGFTGDFVAPPLPSHTIEKQSLLLNWCVHHGLRLINTFSQDIGGPVWTRKKSNSQIDYIAVSMAMEGRSSVWREPAAALTFSDHLPVLAHLDRLTEYIYIIVILIYYPP